jgi:hypothetical protein
VSSSPTIDMVIRAPSGMFTCRRVLFVFTVDTVSGAAGRARCPDRSWDISQAGPVDDQVEGEEQPSGKLADQQCASQEQVPSVRGERIGDLRTPIRDREIRGVGLPNVPALPLTLAVRSGSASVRTDTTTLHRSSGEESESAQCSWRRASRRARAISGP